MSNRYLSSLLEYIFTAGGKSTIRRFEFRRQTDINQAKPTRDPFLFSFFFFYLLYLVISLYLLLFLPFFVASRSHNFLLLAHNETFVRYLDTVRKQLYVSTRTHVTRATINFIHLTTFLLLSPSLSFILSPVFLV